MLVVLYQAAVVLYCTVSYTIHIMYLFAELTSFRISCDMI